MFATLLELLDVGLGGSLAISATLVVAALYVYRAAAVAKVVGALFGTAVGYVIVLCVSAASAIALGWVDPNVAVIIDHVAEGLDVALEAVLHVVERVRDIVRDQT